VSEDTKTHDWYAFNINEHVRVRLTPSGREAVIKAGYEYDLEKVDAEGYTTWQMWVLMKCVGHRMSMGLEPPFEGCAIMFSAKEAKPC
jgi:hypothetical protein